MLEVPHQTSAYYVRFDRAAIPYPADLMRMVQRRLNMYATERPIRRVGCTDPALARWSSPLSTVWGLPGLSLLVANTGSLRTRDSNELNIALGHPARMSGASQRSLPMRVDVCEVPAHLRARFDAARIRIVSNEEWVFHGTADSAIGQIFQQGFEVGGEGVHIVNGASYGRGVYTDTLLTDALRRRYATGNKIILARALPGFQGTADGDWDTRTGTRFDSWVAGASSWRIFRSGDQHLPAYVLHY
ncbi:hypothetical protein T492DRAFT_147776 [Pavlovales sp. CCMP2436]|nr:hypothetical protein T492DRAFT_147776 [Pavlovales sp. CCMP2436]|mmetsp:Transcript_33045/g.82165  ORF Transcript_33045/g.82165 Transcript_33045/m.82165 type:complete len:245 (+) Transcript_33045:267-1001(+)